MDPRAAGLGALAVLPDEVLDHFLRTLDARSLAALSCASRVLNVYCTEEPLWLELHLARRKAPFEYKGSWRATYLANDPACRWPGCTAAALRPPFQVPGFSSMYLYRRWYRGHVDLSGFLPEAEAVPRAEGAGLSPAEFEARYDDASQPVVLPGLTAAWKVDEWQPPALAAALGQRLFKVTKPSGGRMRMALASYLDYCQAQHDEEPVYIFDADFGEAAPELLAAYSVPTPFRWDLFHWAGYHREEYRWLVAGPPRSGASWHVDPAATSAWNTSIVGRKRWALYPPGRVPPGVEAHVRPSGEPDFDTPTSLQWFLEVYPQLAPEDRPLEVVQQPGETIFLPAGWWHCVLNLDFTVAVTQNFVSPANLEAVVAYLSLGAGTLFDEELVPTFLEQRAQHKARASEAARQGQGQAAATGSALPGAAVIITAASQEGGLTTNGTSPLVPSSHTCFSSGSLSGPSSSSSVSEGGSSSDSGSCGSGGRGPGGRGKGGAVAHLRDGMLGFERGGVLGRWLRSAWLGEPELRSRLMELAEKFTEVAAWRRRLGVVCAEAGLPPPQSHEAFPLASGEAAVFQVGDCIVKFCNTELYPPGLAAWQIEAAAYTSLAAQRAEHAQHGGGGASPCGSCSSAAPRLLCMGLLPPEPEELRSPQTGGKHGGAAPATNNIEGGTADGPTTAAAVAAAPAAEPPPFPLPYLVLSKAPGVTLGSCFERLSEGQWAVAASAVGRALADFHAHPLSAGSSGAAGASGSSVQTAWASHHGIVWSSVQGKLEQRAWAQAAAAAATAGGSNGLAAQVPQLPPPLQLYPGFLLLDGGAQAPAQFAAASNGTAAKGEERAPKRPRWAVELTAAEGSAAGGDGRLPGGPWGPWLAFLAYRRKRALRRRAFRGVLPPHLIDQLPGYLPQDAAALLGIPALVAAAEVAAVGEPLQQAPSQLLQPTWVHGDLTAENILFPAGEPDPAAGSCSQEGGAGGEGCNGGAAEHEGGSGASGSGDCEALLLDFADGGQGDPLWDLAALYIRSFRCNPAALRHCLAAYRRRQQEQQPQRQQPGTGQPPAFDMLRPRSTAAAAAAGGVVGSQQVQRVQQAQQQTTLPLSYVATVYTLLHELDLLEVAIKRLPELWEVPSLGELQRRLWGALDEAGGWPQE